MNKGCPLQPEEQVFSYSDENDSLFISSNSIVRHLQQRTSSPLRTEHTFQHKRNVYLFKSCLVSNQKSIHPSKDQHKISRIENVHRNHHNYERLQPHTAALHRILQRFSLPKRTTLPIPPRPDPISQRHLRKLPSFFR
jgi:hypothetical protein